jgi:hypothetical protein
MLQIKSLDETAEGSSSATLWSAPVVRQLEHHTRVAQGVELNGGGTVELPADGDQCSGRKTVVVEGYFVLVLATVAVKQTSGPLQKQGGVLPNLVVAFAQIQITTVLAEGIAEVRSAIKPSVVVLLFGTYCINTFMFITGAPMNAEG